MKPIALLALFALSGCGAIQQEAIRAAPTKSTYMLCSNLVTAPGASSALRNAWADELQRRGENCAQYMPAIAAAQNSEAQQNALALQMLQQGGRQVAPASGAAFLKSQYVSGANRICIYDRLGSQFVVNVGAMQMCPLTQ